jgi:hypothetical protein
MGILCSGSTWIFPELGRTGEIDLMLEFPLEGLTAMTVGFGGT